MTGRTTLVVALWFATVLAVASASHAGTGFTTDEITEWPRPYPHYGDEIEQYSPRLASEGHCFLLAWYEHFYVADWIVHQVPYAARLSGSGEVLDPDGLLMFDSTGGYGYGKEPDVCVVGADYWVFFGYHGLVESYHAKPVSCDGTVGEIIGVGRGTGWESVHSLATAYMSGGNVIAVWQNPYGIDYSLLTPTGEQLIDSAPLLELDWLLDQHAVAVNDPAEPSAPKFLVVYFHDWYTETHIGATRLDAAGNILDDPPIVVVDSITDCAAFDVIPYQDGWLVVYDRGGWKAGVLCGKFVADDGTVSEELFVIDNATPRGLGECSMWVQETDFGFQLAWSVYDWLLAQPDILQYGTIYNLDPSFNILSQDVIPAGAAGSQLCLARDDAGTTAAVWTTWTPDQLQRRLRGGLYTPGPQIARSPAALSWATRANGSPGDQSLAISNTGAFFADLNWSVSSDVEWIGLNPTSGTCAEETDFVAVAIDLSRLPGDPDPVGIHRGTITVSDPESTNLSQATAVTVDVLPPHSPVLFFDDFSEDRGWVGYADDQWERHSLHQYPDPEGDHSPGDDNYLLGYALGLFPAPNDEHDGWYESNMPERAVTSPAIDCSAASKVLLTFWRSLGVENLDHAAIRGSTDGISFDHEIWSNEGAYVMDYSWRECEYDISAWAAGQPTVFIQFVMGPTNDDSRVYGGWNIDDLCLKQVWIEDNDRVISYSGAWSQYDHPAATAGHVTYSDQTGATAALSFEGTGLKWRVGMGPIGGMARVQLDGSPLGLVNLYRRSYSTRWLEKTGLPLGAHTVTIEVSGEKDPASTGYFVDIDAFEVVP